MFVLMADTHCITLVHTSTHQKVTSKNKFSKGIKVKRLDNPNKYTTIPGLSYIGSNHNLSNTRRRPFKHLREVWDKNEIRLLILKREYKHRQTESESDAHREKRENRRMLTCVWLTVGMRECKGMITNWSETQQDTTGKKKKKNQTKCLLPT